MNRSTRIITAAFTIAWLLPGFVYAQHVPTLSVNGDLVTIDADIAWHDNSVPGIVVVQGTPLTQPNIVASSDGSSPIILKMPEGTHTISALGFPADRANPQRTFATLSAVVLPPDRQQVINSAYAKLFQSRDNFIAASSEIVALAPTPAEVATALSFLTP